MYKIFLVCPKLDCANAATNLYRAINKYTECECRLYSGEPSYYDPLDLYNKNTDYDEFMACVEWADIIHFNAHDHAFMPSIDGQQINWEEIQKQKPFIFHSHGGFGGHWTDWIKHPKWWNRYNELGYKKVLCCSAMEELIYENGRYIRNVVNLEDYDMQHRFWDELKVVQTPSAPSYKNTEQFKFECEKYMSKYRFSFNIISGYDHAICVKVRGDHHLLYENSWCGYPGYAGLEAMAQGLAVMAFQEQRAVDRLKEETGSNHNPFINLGRRVKERHKLLPLGTLGMEPVLKTFSEDLEFCKEFAESRRTWMGRYWFPENVVNDYVEVYNSIS